MRLADVVRDEGLVSDGDWVESKDQDPDGDVRLIQLADVGVGAYLNKSARFLTSSKAKELKCTLLQPNDILVARMPDPIGRACVFPGDQKPAVTVVDVCIVRPDPRVCDPRWLCWMVNAPDFASSVLKQARGATRQRISRTELERLAIPRISLGEQRRIAAILDEADALRANRRAALAQLDEMAQAIFVEMFGDPLINPRGYPIVRMGDVCDVRDGTHASPKYVSEGGHPLVTSKNVTQGRLDLSDVNYISSADFAEINRRSKVDVGDIILPMIGTIGSPVIVDCEPNFAIKNVALIKFRAGSPPAQFVHHLLSGAYFDHFAGLRNRGGTQKFVSLGDLRAFPLVFPPREKINVFVERITAGARLAAAKGAAASECDLLFASLQHRAFRGKL
jgi:type I restriction enzyme S subunit